VGQVYANPVNSAVTLICIEMNRSCLEDAKPRRLRPLDLTASRYPAQEASKAPAPDLLVHHLDGQHGGLKWRFALAGPMPVLSSSFFFELADRSDDKAHCLNKETLQ